MSEKKFKKILKGDDRNEKKHLGKSSKKRKKKKLKKGKKKEKSRKRKKKKIKQQEESSEIEDVNTKLKKNENKDENVKILEIENQNERDPDKHVIEIEMGNYDSNMEQKRQPVNIFFCGEKLKYLLLFFLQKIDKTYIL